MMIEYGCLNAGMFYLQVQLRLNTAELHLQNLI